MKILLSFTFEIFDFHISSASHSWRIEFIKFSFLFHKEKYTTGFMPRSLIGLSKAGNWYYVEIFFISFCLNPWRKQ